MNLVISNRVHIPMNLSVHDDLVDRVREKFTYTNPKYTAQVERGMRKLTEEPLIHNWDFTVLNGVQHLSIPRGQLAWLCDVLEVKGIEYTITDQRAQGFPFEVSFNYDAVTPYDYQITGKDLLSTHEQGVWSLWPGAGKTVIAMLMIAEVIKSSTLILVNSEELAKQWSSRIHKFLHYKEEVGHIQKQVCRMRPITIALIQTLMRWSPEQLKALNEYFGAIIYDEAHHGPAEGAREAIEPLSQRYRVALTATETRKDSLEFLLYDYFGKIRQRERGRVMIPTIEQLHTGVQFPWTPRTKWSKIEDFLATHEGRNRQICDRVVADVLNGHKVLTVSRRTSTALMLEQMLTERGIPTKCLIGGSDFNVDSIETEMRAGELQVITSCKLFEEGIDVPPLSSVHLTSHSSNHEMVRQIIGRGCRIDPDKDSAISVDYIDDSPPTKAGGKRRLELYQKLGFKINRGFFSRFSSLF